MPDLVPTQFEFVQSGAIDQEFNCEPATLSVGDIVHFTTLDTWDLASDLSALVAGSIDLGMVTKDSTAGNPVGVARGGAIINLGTAIGITTDEIIVSVNGGKMAPKGDLLTGAFYTSLGYMRSPSELVWRPRPTGLIKP